MGFPFQIPHPSRWCPHTHSLPFMLLYLLLWAEPSSAPQTISAGTDHMNCWANGMQTKMTVSSSKPRLQRHLVLTLLLCSCDPPWEEHPRKWNSFSTSHRRRHWESAWNGKPAVYTEVQTSWAQPCPYHNGKSQPNCNPWTRISLLL